MKGNKKYIELWSYVPFTLDILGVLLKGVKKGMGGRRLSFVDSL